MKRIVFTLTALLSLPLIAMEHAVWQAMQAQGIEMDRKIAMTEELCELIAKTTTEEQDATIQDIQALIDKGCNVKSQNRNHQLPLAFAVYRGLTRIVEFLISKGVGIHGISGYLPVTMLALAIHGCQLEMCEFLIGNKIDLNGNGLYDWTPLMSVTRDIAPCKRQQNQTPEENNHIMANICKTIIDAGAHIHAKDCVGRTALDLADNNGFDELFQLLKSEGAQLKALHEAIDLNLEHTPFIQIRTGTNPNENDSAFALTGMTPLMLAASKDRKELCKELILAGANPFAKDKNNQTATDHANGVGYTTMAKRLEEFQAELLPLSLKQLCINKVRQSVRTGKIPVEKVRALPDDLREHFEILNPPCPTTFTTSSRNPL